MATDGRVLRMLSLVVLLLSMLLAAPASTIAKPSGANGGPGNRGATKMCQGGKWANLAREGNATVAFVSEQECVSHSAQGYTIVELAFPDEQCLGDGFYTWRTSDGGRFDDSEMCVGYVMSGGELAAPVPHFVVTSYTISETQCKVFFGARDLPAGSKVLIIWAGGEMYMVTDSSSPYGDSTFESIALLGQTTTILLLGPVLDPAPSLTFACPPVE